MAGISAEPPMGSSHGEMLCAYILNIEFTVMLFWSLLRGENSDMHDFVLADANTGAVPVPTGIPS